MNAWRSRPRLVGLFAMAVASIAMAQNVDVLETEPGKFRLNLLTDTLLEGSEAQQRLRQAADGLCGDEGAFFGLYQSGKDPQTARFLYSQSVFCGAEPAWEPAPGSGAGILQTSPSQDVNSFIAEISAHYLASRASGEFADAYAALSEQLQTMWTLDDWSSAMQAFNDAAGAVQSIDIRRVTVRDVAEGIRDPGVYIVAEYEAAYEHIPVQCGYVVWVEASRNRYAILREDSKYVSTSGPGRPTKAQLAEFREQLGCAL